MVNPLLLYMGSKQSSFRHIEKYLPTEIEEYREPFIGGGSAILGLLQTRRAPDKIRLGDINIDLVIFWEELLKRPDELRREIVRTVRGLMGQKVSLNELTTYNKQGSEAAAISFILNRLRYCGTMVGGISISEDRIHEELDKILEKIHYGLYSIHNLIPSNTEVRHESYEWALREKSLRDVFVFLDPPYGGTYNDKNYYGTPFNIEGMPRELEGTEHRWLMTINDSTENRELFRGFSIVEHSVYYGSKREYVNELLIRNY